MSKSINLQRREAYFAFSEAKLREVIYLLCRCVQSHGVTIPQDVQDYLDHCDAVKRAIPKPTGNGNSKPDKE